MRRRNFFFCRSDPCASRVAAASSRTPDFATPTAPTLANSSSTARASARWQAAAVPCFGPLRHAPAGIGELARATRPDDSSGSQLAASQSRTSARTSASADLSHRSNSPTLHQQLAMVTRLAEKDLRAFGALEPKMRVVVPGEADAAVQSGYVAIAVCR